MSTTTTSRPGGLKRELRILDAAAFSIGLIGPVGAMAVNGVGAAGILGSGATWAFLFALVGVLLVAYGFIHLSRYISHSGSVYGLVGTTLGPRTGFVAGCALAFAYLTIGAGSTIAISLFTSQVLQELGLTANPDWLLIALLALVVVGALSFTQIRVVTKTLLIVEFLAAGLVLVLVVVIFVKLGTGTAPQGQQLSWDLLALPPGVDVASIGAAAVFGFLAFAGFEGAASLGEETVNPKRDVPRAIVIAVTVVACFYLLTIAAQSLGYGTSPDGVKAFQTTSSAYGELANQYVGKPLAVALNMAAALSSLAITLGTMNASARILFATGRGAGDTRITTRLSRKGEPVVALAITLAVAACIMIGQRIAGSTVLNAALYWLTIGTISLLVAYALATVGAMRFLFLQGRPRMPRWQIIVPILALLFIGYVIYRNAVGVAAPYDRFPYIVAGLIVVATLFANAVPGLADRVRTTLADEVGSTDPIPSVDAQPHSPAKETR
jgi:amino acid transporter